MTARMVYTDDELGTPIPFGADVWQVVVTDNIGVTGQFHYSAISRVRTKILSVGALFSEIHITKFQTP